MPIYRVLETLLRPNGNLIAAGVVSKLPWLTESSKSILLQRGHISEVSAPPLAVLPGWSGKAARIAQVLGIEGSLEFVDASPQEIASALGLKLNDVIALQNEVVGWLTLDDLRKPEAPEVEIPNVEVIPDVSEADDKDVEEAEPEDVTES